MKIRTTRLNDYAEYFFDGATEHGELDTCSYFTCQLYGDVELINRVTNIEGRNFDGNRFEVIRALNDHANDILMKLPLERRGVLIHSGISWIKTMIAENAEILADWAITDETVGGCMKDLKKPPYLNRQGDVPLRLAKRLNSPSFIRRYVKYSEVSDRLRDRGSLVVKRLGWVPNEYLTADVKSLLADLQWQREQNRLQQDVVREEFNAFREGTATRAVIDRVLSRLQPQEKKRILAARKQRKKVLKRAVVIATAILGSANVSALARGDQIQIDGKTASLQVKPTTGLAKIGHGNLAVSMVSRDGTKLAELCVYIEKTPAIDQVTAFALYLQAGMEAELIETANLIVTTPEGAEHPLLKERWRKKMEQRREIDISRIQWHNVDTYELQRTRSALYWAQTNKKWVDCLTVFVLGRNKFILDKLQLRS